MENKNKSNGITLIALVITIVVIVILSAVAMSLALGNNGFVSKTNEAKFKNKMAEIAEEWTLYKASLEMESQDTNIYAGKVLKEIIEVDELENIDTNSVQDIRSILKAVGKTEENYCIIYEGKLYYVSQPKIDNNENQAKWCEDLGIEIWEFTGAVTGVQVVNGKYTLVNGLYLCTPKIDTGFNKDNTRYVYTTGTNNEYVVPGTWINKKPTDDWYDYANKKWANIYVENNGIESYYVWIPRYVYKQDTENSVSGNERTDVIFVDIDNSYKDPVTDEVTTWEQLESQGYILPEAFTWGDSETNSRPISGYWMSKYQLSEFTNSDTYKVDFSTVATSTTMTIRDVKTRENVASSVAKYVYYLNGKKVYEDTTGKQYKIEGLAKGDKSVNVTMLDSHGQIVGSMTKFYGTVDVNPPVTTGFDPYTTFYVYWDENGVEHCETPISKDPPAEWYDYSVSSWANIVTRNEGTESYFVWIPRYQYILDNVSQRTYVKFIKGDSTKTDEGYTIPEAFTWGDDESNMKQLTGYWMAKYQLSEKPATGKVVAEIGIGETTASVGNITGTMVVNNEETANNIKFIYYIDGTKVHEGTDPNEKYTFTGLQPKTTYGFTIIARNKSTNAFLGAITHKLTTTVINKPDLTGFNKNQTYYVTGFDSNGEAIIGNNLNGSEPSNWYNYGTKNWANIVVTDGTVSNGKITGATYTSYFVWIPRYQYKLDETTQRVDVKFIEDKSTQTITDYTIPEAFTWGDNESNMKQLTGYWMSKYQLSN